ncbi:hypothetical protein BaRGS_00011497 [Batillaria attramentaria]|uniref:Uncharacterized protein n=1 Tax=Batillaria attramentaria TaxID=370345 RepID=A0ABD0LD05_9CAEN
MSTPETTSVTSASPPTPPSTETSTVTHSKDPATSAPETTSVTSASPPTPPSTETSTVTHTKDPAMSTPETTSVTSASPPTPPSTETSTVTHTKDPATSTPETTSVTSASSPTPPTTETVTVTHTKDPATSTPETTSVTSASSPTPPTTETSTVTSANDPATSTPETSSQGHSNSTDEGNTTPTMDANENSSFGTSTSDTVQDTVTDRSQEIAFFIGGFLSCAVCVLAAGFGVFLYRRHRKRQSKDPGIAPDLPLHTVPSPAPPSSPTEVAGVHELSPADVQTDVDVGGEDGYLNIYSSLAPLEERDTRGDRDNYTSLPQRYTNVSPPSRQPADGEDSAYFNLD